MSKNPKDLIFGHVSYELRDKLYDFIFTTLPIQTFSIPERLSGDDKNNAINFIKKNCLRVSVCRERFDHFSIPKKLMGKFGGGPLDKKNLPENSQYLCKYSQDYVFKNHFSIPKDEVFNVSKIPKHINDGDLVLFIPPEVIMNPFKFSSKQSANLFILKNEYTRLPTLSKELKLYYPYDPVRLGNWSPFHFLTPFMSYIPHVKGKDVDNDFSAKALSKLRKTVFLDVT